MTLEKICLASDNFSPAHPVILQAMEKANQGFTPSYGADPWTESASNLIVQSVGRPAKVFFVPSGTGSNVLALKICCRRYESVICSDIAHIDYQESGAAESIVGCKLLTVPSIDGKITPDVILHRLKKEKAFGKHSTSPRVLSISQSTEVGTVYSLKELRALSQFCKEHDLLFHIDGSRFYNAAVSLGVSLAEMAQFADILSLGGTKNGLVCGESLLVFHQDLQKGSDHLHKQTLQLTSKMRFISSQYLAFFLKDLWKDCASNANQKAAEIASFIQEIPQLSISYPVQTNQIFFTAPLAWIPLIQEKIQCYLWNQEKGEIRFITSWNTNENDIKSIKDVLMSIN